MDARNDGGAPDGAIPPVWTLVRIGLVALLVLSIVAGSGVVAAGNHGSQGKAPCPYDNGNQGAANAADKGLSNSQTGISTAADQISGCQEA